MRALRKLWGIILHSPKASQLVPPCDIITVTHFDYSSGKLFDHLVNPANAFVLVFAVESASDNNDMEESSLYVSHLFHLYWNCRIILIMDVFLPALWIPVKKCEDDHHHVHWTIREHRVYVSRHLWKRFWFQLLGIGTLLIISSLVSSLAGASITTVL